MVPFLRGAGGWVFYKLITLQRYSQQWVLMKTNRANGGTSGLPLLVQVSSWTWDIGLLIFVVVKPQTIDMSKAIFRYGKTLSDSKCLQVASYWDKKAKIGFAWIISFYLQTSANRTVMACFLNVLCPSHSRTSFFCIYFGSCYSLVCKKRRAALTSPRHIVSSVLCIWA